MGEAARFDTIVAGGELAFERPAANEFADALAVAFQHLGDHAFANRSSTSDSPASAKLQTSGARGASFACGSRHCSFCVFSKGSDAGHGPRATPRRQSASGARRSAPRHPRADDEAIAPFSKCCVRRVTAPGVVSGQPSASSSLARQSCERLASSDAIIAGACDVDRHDRALAGRERRARFAVVDDLRRRRQRRGRDGEAEMAGGLLRGDGGAIGAGAQIGRHQPVMAGAIRVAFAEMRRHRRADA